MSDELRRVARRLASDARQGRPPVKASTLAQQLELPQAAVDAALAELARRVLAEAVAGDDKRRPVRLWWLRKPLRRSLQEAAREARKIPADDQADAAPDHDRIAWLPDRADEEWLQARRLKRNRWR